MSNDIIDVRKNKWDRINGAAQSAQEIDKEKLPAPEAETVAPAVGPESKKTGKARKKAKK